ncbi:MAG: hypothetical protein ACOCU4_03715 [Alkalispirochaeta sp.]
MISACSVPFSPSDPGTSDTAPGELVVSLAGDADGAVSLGASTVLPDIDPSQIDTYRFTLDNGPSGASPPDPVIQPANESDQLTDAVVFSDIVPGTWQVTVEAIRTTGDTDETILRGREENVDIAAGMRTEIDVTLVPATDATGTIRFTVEWPSDQNIIALEYRTEHDGSASAWTRISATEFDQETEVTRAEVLLEDVPAGTHIVSWRLDRGALAWSRYRAAGEEIFHVSNAVESSAVYTLEVDDFSARAPEPGSWEQLQDDGEIVVNPDGSVTFTQDGYDATRGGDDIDVDPNDYSVTFSGSGERRLYMEMPSVTTARLEIDGAHMTQGSGWGIFFHGSDPASGAEFSGYTLQFDPGLGDKIVVRQWEDGSERSPFIAVEADTAGDDSRPDIDLYAPMNVVLDVDAGALTVTVEQPIDSDPFTIISEEDITSMAGVTGTAREAGFMGLRNWSSTDLTFDALRLYVED